MMNEKIAVVNQLVENGYHLFNETVEQFAERFTLEDLKMFLNCFLHRI